MSLFRSCETCGRIAEVVCECLSTSQFFCEAHSSDHRKSGGSHPFQNAFIPLMSEEVSFLQSCFYQYKIEFIRESIHQRNTEIEDLLRQIRKVEEYYYLRINWILDKLSIIKEISVYRGLPIFCDDPFVSSLISLQKSSAFNNKETLNRLFSSHYNLPNLSSSLPPLCAPFQPLSSSELSFPPQLEQPTRFIAHDQPIESVAVSDCERYLASGSEDKTIKIWDSQSLECLYILNGHTKWVRSVTFCGNKLISGSGDKTIKIWEAGACLETLLLHSDTVMSVCVSSCKRLLASGGVDKIVFVYNLEERKIKHSLLSHSNSVNSVVFSPSDKQIVSGSADKSIKVWSTETGELLKTLSGHSNAVTCVCFSESFIVSSSSDRKINIWDIEKEEALVMTLCGHSSNVVRVEACGNILASLGQDNCIKIWDRNSEEIIQVLEGHGDYSQDKYWYMMSLKFLRGGKFIISGGRDKNIAISRILS